MSSAGSPCNWSGGISRCSDHRRIRDARASGASRVTTFTSVPREIEVLRLLPTSMTQLQMAAHLYVSRKTIQNNASSLYRKLGPLAAVTAWREPSTSACSRPRRREDATDPRVRPPKLTICGGCGNRQREAEGRA